MSNAATSGLATAPSSAPTAIGWGAGVLLLAWLALVVWLAAAGAFAGRPGQPPIALLAAVVGPIILFLAAERLSHRFGEIVRAVDLPLITGLQAWRFGGFVFLALWAQGLLPGYFAWPAGAGDMAIAVAAPWLTLALVRRPGFAAAKSFVVWNLLGILDLVVAVTLGALGPIVLGQGPAGVDAAIMATLPMALIPAYFVPIFVILHLVALTQSRRQRGRR